MTRLGPLILMAAALAACGSGEDATAPLAETGEPDTREREMLDDAASMLDEDAAEPPLPAEADTPGNGGE